MKKRKKLICTIVAVVIGIIVVLRICFDFTNTYTLKDGMVNGTMELSKIDEIKIKWILNNHLLYEDYPACGFSNNAAVTFNDGEQAYYIASDTCSIVYDVKAEKYFRIGPLSKVWLYAILDDYGVTFPCV